MKDESTLKNGTPTDSDAAGTNSLKDEWTKARRAVNQAATKAEVTGKAKQAALRAKAKARVAGLKAKVDTKVATARGKAKVTKAKRAIRRSAAKAK